VATVKTDLAKLAVIGALRCDESGNGFANHAPRQGHRLRAQ
jgi:hypothetical protein